MWSIEYQRRRLGRTACVTLCAWLLALVAGVANACLLPTPAVKVAGAAFAVPAALAGHAAAVDHADVDDGAAHDGRASCQKFCADESTSLAKKSAQPFDFSPLAVVEFTLRRRLDVSAVRVAHRLAEPPARPGPSLVIRLLRLTT